MKNPINKFIQDLEKEALNTLKNLNKHLEKFPKKEPEEKTTWYLSGKDLSQEEHKQYPIGGFAPGGYYHKACVTCSQEFLGDKRAVQCEPCAIEMVNTKVKVNDKGGVEINELKSYEEIITTEFEKCKNSPYYFATKYITIGGLPFRTYMNEEEFNKLVKYCEK